MKPLFGTAQYCTPAAFDAESRAIFERLWMLAAITPMLAKHNDFRCVTIAGVPLVLQNGQGRIRAFANICRHRAAPIQTTDFGHRPLVCPYHHWSYDSEGRLARAHADPAVFALSDDETAAIRLREFAVEVVGSLVFVNLADRPLPIAEQFGGALLDRLVADTSRMDSAFVHTSYECAFDWKIGMENIKDPLHVQVLHRASFPADMRFDIGVSAPQSQPRPTGAPGDRGVRRMPLHQASTLADVAIERAEPLEWQPLVEHLGSKGFYRQIGLFPNVNLMIVDGTSFAIQVYNPLASGRVEMQMTVALTKPVADFPYKPVVLWEHLRSDMTVLREDIECLEALQRNFAAAEDGVVHGAYESAIIDFQAACLDQLDQLDADPAAESAGGAIDDAAATASGSGVDRAHRAGARP